MSVPRMIRSWKQLLIWSLFGVVVALGPVGSAFGQAKPAPAKVVKPAEPVARSIPTLRDGEPIYYDGFVADEKQWPADRRTRLAKKTKEAAVRQLFAQAGVAFPPAELLFRAFKHEKQMEVWAASVRGEAMKLIATYTVCAASGELGPKREELDYQVPEGFYHVDLMHGLSRYFLAFRITYPNRSDCILGTENRQGSAIMIHGNCASIGCLSMGDGGISELWLMADSLMADSFRRNRKFLHVHIFPQRDMETLIKDTTDETLRPFWSNIRGGLDYFEKHHIPPKVCIDSEGKYVFGGSGSRCAKGSHPLGMKHFEVSDCPR